MAGLERAATAGDPGTAGKGTRRPRPRVFLRGATISGLNPKGLLLYLSVLPQFLDPGADARRWPSRRPSSGSCTWRAAPPST